MNRIVITLCLLLVATLSLAENDIWNSLFREKLNEATAGDSAAQFDVGTMYQNGRGTGVDRTRAIEWYRKAAAQNNTQAASRLKLLEENAARFEKTRLQAEKGNRESLYDLGNMYLTGVGADVDYNSAIKAFEQAAGLGNDKAAYRLGLVYYEGTGVRSNPTAAFKWFSIAANNNFPAAQYYLGKMYGEGKGTRRSNKLALEWLSKAVDSGFDQARGEMINVTENIDMEKAVPRTEVPKPELPTVEVAPQSTGVERDITMNKEPAKPAAAKITEKQQVKIKAPHRQYHIEDLMHGAWNRDDSPVPYLPSAINTCRTEAGRIICFSDRETRKTGNNLVRFKTKAIIENFSEDGNFLVTYRNLVIDAIPETGTDITLADGSSETSYPVKTGWGSPHTLNCNFKDTETLSCLKNNTHAFLLTSPRTLAAGE